MNPSIHKLTFPACTAAIGWLFAALSTAQTFTTIHSFRLAGNNPSSYYTNSDGADPESGLLVSGNTLYGTASLGGTNGDGTVFATDLEGTSLTPLHNFAAGNFHLSFYSSNVDGAFPAAGLILAGNTLYGTAEYGGTSGSGAIFSLATNGASFTCLHDFEALTQMSPAEVYTNSDGANVESGLILAGHTLYGTASIGGTNGNGTVFGINTDNLSFAALHHFTALVGNTNSDGANPFAGLILEGSTCYGTASSGGAYGCGTVFALQSDGTGFRTLHSFAALINNTNAEGAYPHAGLVLAGDTLFGTTYGGGANGSGTTFALKTDGLGFAMLHSFGALYSNTNDDGSNPFASLILSGNTLYGTAYYGGASGNGTLFAMNTNGTGFTLVHSFATLINNTNGDGANPFGSLVISRNALYGSTYTGGIDGNGALFNLSFTPQLIISMVAANAVVTWPVAVAGFDYSGFTLESETNLEALGGWAPVATPPVVINGQNTVTNHISGSSQFFELSR